MLSAIYFWLFLLCINKSAIFHIETFFELCEPRKQWFSAEPQLELFGSTCHDLLEKCLLCYRMQRLGDEHVDSDVISSSKPLPSSFEAS